MMNVSNSRSVTEPIALHSIKNKLMRLKATPLTDDYYLHIY